MEWYFSLVKINQMDIEGQLIFVKNIKRRLEDNIGGAFLKLRSFVLQREDYVKIKIVHFNWIFTILIAFLMECAISF